MLRCLKPGNSAPYSCIIPRDTLHRLRHVKASIWRD